jgi:hypothetical protein
LIAAVERPNGLPSSHQIPSAAWTPHSTTGKSIMTAMPRFAGPAEARAWLKDAHPDWSIVHSDKGRWWGFLDTKKRRKDAVPYRTTAADADTPEKLHELLDAAGS